MTTQDRRVVPLASRVPAATRAPLGITAATLYPALWNPDPLVRHVFATFMIAGLVWLVLAGVAICHGYTVVITDKIIDRQIEQLRADAKAELDGHADAHVDAEWTRIVQRFTAPRRPEESK